MRLRKLIQRALKLPDGSVIGGWLPENKLSRFITVDMMSSKEIGQSKRVFDGEKETITTSCLSVVSISCYGSNSVRVAMKLRTILQSSELIDAFKAMNAGIVSFSDVRNLTATIPANFEERGQFDCEISHHHIVETLLNPIEQVDVATNNHLVKQIRGNS